MNDPVVEFYKNVDFEEYLKKLYDLPPNLLIEEFDTINSFFESSQLDMLLVGKLFDLVKTVIYNKLQFADNKNKWASVDQYEIFLNQQIIALRRGE